MFPFNKTQKKSDEPRSEEDRRRDAVNVVPVPMLGEVPDVTVQIGQAPDGLPLLLSVRRSTDVVTPVLRALGQPSLDHVDTQVRRLLQELHARVAMQRRDLGVLRGSGDAVYVTDTSVPHLLGTTMFARLVDNTSPLTDDASRFSGHNASNDRDVRTCAGVLKSAVEMKDALEATNSVRHMAIPLVAKRSPFVVTTNHVNDKLVSAPRPLDLESLACFRTARAVFYTTDARGASVVHHVKEIGGDEYRERLLSENLSGIAISRTEMLARITEVCADVEKLHRNSKQIHGDLKPANILMGAKGARAFDSSGTEIGDVSVAGTPSWSAPEQIMALPVTPAADVYALALLVARVLGATIYGEQRTFTIPVSGQRRVRIELLVEPEAFLDPTVIELPDDGHRAWRALLKEGLAFHAEKRIATPLAFAERVAAVCAKFPIRSQALICRLPGTLAKDVLINDGLTSGWLLHENCTGHAASQVGSVGKAIAA